MDASGVFIAGLTSSDVAVVEDNAILPGQVTEIRPGAQIVLAFDLPGEMNQRRVAETLHAFGQPAVEPLLGVLKTPPRLNGP